MKLMKTCRPQVSGRGFPFHMSYLQPAERDKLRRMYGCTAGKALQPQVNLLSPREDYRF